MYNKKPLVSFCTQTYNSAGYVVELLECAKSQTYSRLELIVSDDCSKDNTLEVINDWISHNKSRFERCVVLSNSRNLGYSGNKSRAEEQCRGDYIKTIDSDDWIAPTFIEKAVAMLESRPDCGFLYCNTMLFTNGHYEKEPSYHIDGDAFKDLFTVDFLPPTPSWFYKKEVKENTCYRPEMYLSDDYMRLLDIAHKFNFCHLDEYLAYYRVSSYIKFNIIRNFEYQLLAIDHYQSYPLYPQRRAKI